MDAATLLAFSLAAHLCKSPFRRRAHQMDGNVFVGLLAALMYLVLSLTSLGAAGAAVIMMGVNLWN